jgi:excisionase family DNA binding protein
VTTRLISGNKWGTSNPIMMRDADLGVVRARAFGTFDFRVVDPKVFLREVAGSDHDFRTDEFAEVMRSRVVSVFSDALATAEIPVLDVARRYTELGEALLPVINPVVRTKYGIEIAMLVVENVSVPPEVEQAIDKRSSMAAVGDLNTYVKFQLAQGLARGGGVGGVATEMAMGLAIAQQFMQQQGLAAPVQAPAMTPLAPVEMLSPAEAARILGVNETDVMAIIVNGELKAKQIGSAYRVRRTDLDVYLAG